MEITISKKQWEFLGEKTGWLKLTSSKINDEIQHCLSNFPLIRQPDGSTCGHTSLSMVAKYYRIDKTVAAIKKISPKKQNKEGLSPQSIVKAAEEIGIKATIKKNLSFKEIKTYLDDNIPLIIELQAWAEKEVKDWKNEWKEGHFVVAIGYTEDSLIFADPSSNDKVFLKFKELLPRWHDNDYGTKNEKLVIVMEMENKGEKIVPLE